MKKAKELILAIMMITVIALPGIATIELGTGSSDTDVVSPLDKGERGEQFL